MNTMQKRRRDMSSSLDDAYATSREMVADNPLTSTLVAFGAGAAIGVILGHALGASVRHQPETASSAMEKLGRQVCDAVRGSLPESIARHLPS
jgi:hypothetical protein